MLRPILALKAGSPEAASLCLPMISLDDRNLGDFYHLPSLFPLPQISREVQQFPKFLLDTPQIPPHGPLGRTGDQGSVAPQVPMFPGGS